MSLSLPEGIVRCPIASGLVSSCSTARVVYAGVTNVYAALERRPQRSVRVLLCVLPT